MKKQHNDIKRILGRTLAREMTREELQATQGAGGLKKSSLSEPPDND